MNIAIALLILLLLSSCTVGPDYTPPTQEELALPDTGIDTDGTTSMANLTWQEYYAEPELKALIAKALQRNISLQQALESVSQSFRARGIADIALLPTFTANLDGEKDSISALASSDPRIEDEFDLNVGLRWEIDFWGKLRRASEGAMADLQASKANLYAAKISLIAQTANLYYELQDIKERITLTESNIKAREDSLRIVKLRHKQGIISGLDVRQARVSLAQEKIKLPSLFKVKNIVMFQLSVLVGESPATMQSIGERQDVDAYKSLVPVGLPSSLLTRRPDIIAAERNIQSATAGIGVATAGYFPNIVLTGRWGNRTRDFDDILENAGRTFLLEANIEMPLWDWGLTTLNVENAESQHRIALLSYQQVVLDALKDVASSLEEYREAFTVFDLRKTLVNATSENLKIAQLRYDNGVVSYLDVLDAQRNHASAEKEFSSAIKAKQLSMVSLYRSLGGGWNESEQACTFPDSIPVENGNEETQIECPVIN